MSFPYYPTSNLHVSIKLDKESYDHLRSINASISITNQQHNNRNIKNFVIYSPVTKRSSSLLGYLFTSKCNLRNGRINTSIQNNVYDFTNSNLKNSQFNSNWYRPKYMLEKPDAILISNDHNQKMRKAYASLSSENQFDINELVELVESLSKETKERSNLILNIIDTRIIDNASNKSNEIRNSTKKVADLQSLLNEEVLRLKRLQS